MYRYFTSKTTFGLQFQCNYHYYTNISVYFICQPSIINYSFMTVVLSGGTDHFTRSFRVGILHSMSKNVYLLSWTPLFTTSYSKFIE